MNLILGDYCKLQTLFWMGFFCLNIHLLQAQDYVPVAYEEVNPDGMLDEWGDTLAYSDEKNRLRYAFRQDSVFLYVAIHKSGPARKAILPGAVQVFFDQVKPADTSFGISYPVVKSHDRTVMPPDFEQLVIENLHKPGSDTVSAFNEWGIIGRGAYKPSTVVKPAIIYNDNEIPQPNDEFLSELAIPKSYLPENNNGLIEFRIVLRGNDLKKDGALYKQFVETQMRSQNTIGDSLGRTMKDYNVCTEYIGKLRLQKL